MHLLTTYAAHLKLCPHIYIVLMSFALFSEMHQLINSQLKWRNKLAQRNSLFLEITDEHNFNIRFTKFDKTVGRLGSKYCLYFVYLLGKIFKGPRVTVTQLAVSEKKKITLLLTRRTLHIFSCQNVWNFVSGWQNLCYNIELQAVKVTFDFTQSFKFVKFSIVLVSIVINACCSVPPAAGLLLCAWLFHTGDWWWLQMLSQHWHALLYPSKLFHLKRKTGHFPHSGFTRLGEKNTTQKTSEK